jgi:hypothetical protein
VEDHNELTEDQKGLVACALFYGPIPVKPEYLPEAHRLYERGWFEILTSKDYLPFALSQTWRTSLELAGWFPSIVATRARRSGPSSGLSKGKPLVPPRNVQRGGRRGPSVPAAIPIPDEGIGQTLVRRHAEGPGEKRGTSTPQDRKGTVRTGDTQSWSPPVGRLHTPGVSQPVR